MTCLLHAISQVTNRIFKIKGIDENNQFANQELKQVIKTSLEKIEMQCLIQKI